MTTHNQSKENVSTHGFLSVGLSPSKPKTLFIRPGQAGGATRNDHIEDLLDCLTCAECRGTFYWSVNANLPRQANDGPPLGVPAFCPLCGSSRPMPGVAEQRRARLLEAAGQAGMWNNFRSTFLDALSLLVGDRVWDTGLRLAQQAAKKKPVASSTAVLLAGVLLLTLALAPAPAVAQQLQQLPDAPQPKPKVGRPIFNLETVNELELVAGSLAADAMSTEKALEFNHSSVGCGVRGPHCQVAQEINPVARIFVRNRIGTGFYFGGAAALDVYGTYWLRKHRHPWIARLMNISVSAGEGILAGRNYAMVNNSDLEFLLHHPVAQTANRRTKFASGPDTGQRN